MRILSAALIALMSSTVVLAQEPIKLTDGDRAKIVSEVIQHFKDNPEELVSAIVEWREKSEKTETTKPSERLADPVSGFAGAPVSIIEFSDYGCVPCNDVSKILDSITTETPDVRIIHRDTPRSNIDAVSASLDMISVASKGGDWKSMRETFLTAGVQPETRIAALSKAGVEVTNADRAKAAETMTVSKGLAERSGIAELPAVIVVVGNKVQALPGPQTRDTILNAIVSVKKAAAADQK